MILTAEKIKEMVKNNLNSATKTFKQLLSDHPELIKEVVEPAVNELISDADIPKLVKDQVEKEFLKFKEEIPHEYEDDPIDSNTLPF